MRAAPRLMFIFLAVTLCHAQMRHAAEAVRLNNQGVAQMSQGLTDRAEASFAAALASDPKLEQAAINQGIALLAKRKLPEAEAALRRAIALDPTSAQAWYNLGLVQHEANEIEAALASFQQAAKLDRHDADSRYFQGVCYQDLKQVDNAITTFRKVLDLQPLHASAEFALARSLRRAGRVEEARQHFQRFHAMTDARTSTVFTSAYGEQGHYSTVVPVQGPDNFQRHMIPVKLVAQSLTDNADPGAWATTGGACMMDITGSSRMDLVLMQQGAQAIRVLRDGGDGGFEDWDAQAAGLRASGHGVACAVGDFDRDGLNDLAVALDERLLLFRNLGHGKFLDVTAASGVASRNRPSGITFVDYDHDGDLDLFLTGAPLRAGDSPNVLWRNNGDGTFTEQTSAIGLGGKNRTAAAILTDFNNDRAVDLATTGESPSPLLYVNPREGSYPVQPLDVHAGLGGTVGIAVLDFNKDGWMDIAVTHSGAPGLTLWRNKEGRGSAGRRFQRVMLPLQDAMRGWGLTPIDIDNDGWIDLAAIVEAGRGAHVRVFRNRGDGSFEDVSRVLGLDNVLLHQPRGLIAADVTGNGASDLIVTQIKAPPLLLRNLGANKNHSIRLELAGYADNKTGIGTKVEVFAGGLWQKWELAGASGYMTQGPPQLHVGMGTATGIDLLRMLWPTGVLQDEIDLPRQPTITMKEVDRRGSSCPVLFAWDGHRYKFITDVIGAAVVGHWFTPARRNIPRPEEWVKVEGASVALVDGEVSLRFMEPMEEVNYIDQLRLVAVDHPEDVEVNPDERFLDDPPFASGRVIASAQTHSPKGAWDGEGRDVSALLSKRDHQFAGGFTALPYDGFANLHALTLDLGAINPNAPLRLLMSGYVNYFSATSLYAAWQAGLKEIPPYVEAQQPDGSWQHIPGDAGFPAGLERTIVVDLTGKLPAGTRRVRFMTNLQIYWDQVLIDQSTDMQTHATELPLTHAVLHFRGYPKQIEGRSPGDLDYDYNLVSLTGPFQRERGNYTRFGDVTPLLGSIDDRFVIFGSGEEIAARFDASQLPALPDQWRRDYFFYANGYVKDMDWWDASPFTVAQMPFHKMTAYPYSLPGQYPNDAALLEYQLNWNERLESGDPVRSYRFDFHLLPMTPAADSEPVAPSVPKP